MSEQNQIDFTNIIGVNTHIDFRYPGSPYTNLDKVINAIHFLGVKHLRDCAGKPFTHDLWKAVYENTKARFCAYLPEAGPSVIETCFGYLESIYDSGMIDFFEGPNEPDDYYAISQGNSIVWSANYTTHLAPWVHTRGKKLINLSVGSGWQNPDGDYDAIPLSYVVDYGNAHVYPMPKQDVLVMLDRIIKLAAKSAPGKPVMVTELGWALNQGHTMAEIAADIVKAAHANLTPRIYLYALFDDRSGQFGLFNDDGSPRPAAIAVRKLLGGQT